MNSEIGGKETNCDNGFGICWHIEEIPCFLRVLWNPLRPISLLIEMGELKRKWIVSDEYRIRVGKRKLERPAIWNSTREEM